MLDEVIDISDVETSEDQVSGEEGMIVVSLPSPIVNVVLTVQSLGGISTFTNREAGEGGYKTPQVRTNFNNCPSRRSSKP